MWFGRYVKKASGQPELLAPAEMRTLLAWLADRGAHVSLPPVLRKDRADAAAIYAWAQVMVPGFAKGASTFSLPRLRLLAGRMMRAEELRDATAILRDATIPLSTDAGPDDNPVTFVWQRGDRPRDPRPARTAALDAVDAVREWVSCDREASPPDEPEWWPDTKWWTRATSAARACERAAAAWGLAGDLRVFSKRLDLTASLNAARAAARSVGDDVAHVETQIGGEIIRLVRTDAWLEGTIDAIELARKTNDQTRQHPDAIARAAVAIVTGIGEGTINTLRR